MIEGYSSPLAIATCADLDDDLEKEGWDMRGFIRVYESGIFFCEKEGWIIMFCFLLLSPSSIYSWPLCPKYSCNSFSPFSPALVSSLSLLRTSGFYSYSFVNPIRSFFKNTINTILLFLLSLFLGITSTITWVLCHLYVTLKVTKIFKSNKYYPTQISGPIRLLTNFYK